VPVATGNAILNWKKPDPRLKDRDAEVARLAFAEGLGQKEIAEKIAAQGYSPVTPDRIGQVLNAHSGRDRIIRFLVLAPEGAHYTSKEIAIALSIDIARVQYVLDGLQKKNIVSFRDVRNGPDSSDHKTKVDIHLNRKARGSRIVTSVMGHPAVGSIPVAAVVNTKPSVEEPLDHPDLAAIFEPVVTDVGLQQDEAYDRVAEHIAKVAAGARKLQEEINAMGAGPKPGNSGPGSDEDWGPTVTEQPVQPKEPAVPWFPGNMGGWPSMRDVRDRHNKAVKIRAAAALLEEVGEDDTALALLDKITFSLLEEEVVQLLRFLKEIE